MPNSDELEIDPHSNAAERRAAVERWAAYVRTHDDAEWSRQQNRLVDSQLQTANEMAARGEIDPVQFVAARDGRRSGPADRADTDAGD
jgi:hypothetical protein